jgi:hypothetical protein
MFSLTAFANKKLAKMPVGAMQDPHKNQALRNNQGLS